MILFNILSYIIQYFVYATWITIWELQLRRGKRWESARKCNSLSSPQNVLINYNVTPHYVEEEEVAERLWWNCYKNYARHRWWHMSSYAIKVTERSQQQNESNEVKGQRENISRLRNCLSHDINYSTNLKGIEQMSVEIRQEFSVQWKKKFQRFEI